MSGATAVWAETGVGIKTDRNIYPEPPAPPLPRAGGIIVDPTFGTEIMRVTDEADTTGAGTAYSYWPTFNQNNTRLLAFYADSFPRVYEFDPKAFRLGASHVPPSPPASQGGWLISTFEDATWSSHDPNKFFVHRGTAVFSYDVNTRSYSPVFDLTNRFPAGSYFFQMSVSRDDDTFAFTVKDASYREAGYAAYRRSTGTLVVNVKTVNINEAQIDKTGRYLLVQTGVSGVGAIEARVFDLSTGGVEDLRDDGPDYAPAHGDSGTGTFVGGDNWNARLTVRNLATPHQMITGLDSNGQWDNDCHTSMLADNEGWVLLSFFGAAQSGMFQRELVQVSTDGNQRLRRLAHHHSVYRSYYDTPRANISRDGRFIAFTSNWGGRARGDLFVAKIPPPDSTSTTPTPTPIPTPTPVATGAAAIFVKADGATKGDWKGLYGTAGYNVVNDAANYPSYAQVTPQNALNWTWTASTNALHALRKVNATDRLAATLYSDTTFDIQLNLTDGQYHQLALYCVDWDVRGRAQRIEILDAVSGSVLDSRNVSDFTQGQYLVWTLKGHVKIRLTKTAGANAVVSGIFFDAATVGLPNPTPTPTPIPTPVPTPIPTPVPTPMPTPVPTPVPGGLVSPPKVATAHATALALANLAQPSEAQINVLTEEIWQASNAFATEASSFTYPTHIAKNLLTALYFSRAAASLAAAGAPAASVRNRLQISAARLGQVRELMQSLSGSGAPGGQSSNSLSEPVIGQTATHSSASFAPVVARESMATILGDAVQSPLAAQTSAAPKRPDGALPFELAGASVTVGGHAAPILFVSPANITFCVPTGLASGEAEVIVTSQEGFVSRGTMTVVAVAPGIFTSGGTNGTGEAIVMNGADFTLGAFDTTTPNALGSDKRTRLMLFATGLSNADNFDVNNDVTTGAGRLSNVAESVVVEARTGDGRAYSLPVEYAGKQGKLAGVDQITFMLVPELRGAGRVELTVFVGGQASNVASINVR